MPPPMPSLQFLRLSTWQIFLPHHTFPSMSTHCNIDDGSKPEILSIPTEDLGSIPVIRVDERVPPALSTSSGCHSRGPSDPRAIPPSPTLSTQCSVYFMASTALRDNKPDGEMASLAFAGPGDGTIADQSAIPHIYPATSNTTNSVRSPIENLKSPAPPHVGSTSEIDEFENQIRDHWKPVKKVESGVQAVKEAEADDIDMVKARDDPQLFPRLRRARASPFSFILKSRPSGTPNDDRVTP